MKLLAKIISALFIGCMVALFLLQNDDRFSDTVHAKLKDAFEHMFACKISYTIKSINFFQGRLLAQQVCVESPENDWSWQAQEFVLDISLLSLFTLGKVGLEIAVSDVRAESLLKDGIPAINNHLKKLILEAGDFACTLKSLAIRKGSLKLFDEQRVLAGFFDFSSEMNVSAYRLKNTFYITNAQFSLWDIPFISNAYAHIALEKTDNGLHVVGNGTISIDLFESNEKDCYFTAEYNGQSAKINVHNKTHSLQSDIVLDPFGKCSIESKFPITLLNKLFFFITPAFSGSCASALTINYAKDFEVHGTLSVDNAYYQTFSLGSIKTNFDKTKDAWKGLISFDHKTGGTMEGSWEWFERLGRGQLEVVNTATLQSKMTYWYVKAHDAQIKCIFERNMPTTGFYTCVARHTILNSQVQTQGNFVIGDSLKAQGSVGKNNYSCIFDFNPKLILKRLSYNDFHGKTFLSVGTNPKNIKDVQARINYQFIRGLFKDLYGVDMRGEGDLTIKAYLEDTAIQATMAMENVHIQIPETYNFIHNIHAKALVDKTEKSLILNDTCIDLHKGSVECKRGVLCWDDLQDQFFVHIPLLCKHVFLNVDKDVFAEFSGNILLEKRDNNFLMCRGSLTVDDGQCKKNIFSSVSQKDVASRVINPLSVFYRGIGCNLRVKTKKPFAIQTSFLHTNAHVDIAIQESIDNPLVTGNIDVSSGMLAFPYKPLYITKGTIYFLPHQLDDPAIELVAQGKVKKYHVVLHANGSLQRPHISLASTPPLTEEQIITLLLAGSEEGSVALVMPTLIMQNLENLLFGPEQPSSKLEGYFKNLLGPLKHIRVVPSFFDQTGRGGLRGAFEIDVSERLHALIEKNFSLSEDTRYEVEYLVSDDMTVRGIKDQRGDVGGEVEMRWKF